MHESALNYGISEQKLDEIIDEIRVKIDLDFAQAVEDDLPKPSDLYKGVF